MKEKVLYDREWTEAKKTRARDNNLLFTGFKKGKWHSAVSTKTWRELLAKRLQKKAMRTFVLAFVLYQSIYPINVLLIPPLQTF